MNSLGSGDSFSHRPHDRLALADPDVRHAFAQHLGAFLQGSFLC